MLTHDHADNSSLFLGIVSPAGSHVILVLPAGSHLPVVSYDWLASGT